MSRVRDVAISRFEKTLSGDLKSEQARELHRELSTIPPELLSTVRRTVYRAIDDVLFQILELIDSDDRIDVHWSGVDIQAESDGLAGELFSHRGWISRMSEYAEM